jgi:hypothetical protein
VKLGWAWGVKKNKFPKKNQTRLKKRKRKGQHEFTKLVSLGIGKDEKGTPINAPITTRKVYKENLSGKKYS